MSNNTENQDVPATAVELATRVLEMQQKRLHTRQRIEELMHELKKVDTELDKLLDRTMCCV